MQRNAVSDEKHKSREQRKYAATKQRQMIEELKVKQATGTFFAPQRTDHHRRNSAEILMPETTKIKPPFRHLTVPDHDEKKG